MSIYGGPILRNDFDVQIHDADQHILQDFHARGGGNAAVYEGATHAYDTPMPNRENVAVNIFATDDIKRRAEAFFERYR